jgi:hypothetical protein
MNFLSFTRVILTVKVQESFDDLLDDQGAFYIGSRLLMMIAILLFPFNTPRIPQKTADSPSIPVYHLIY